VSWINELTEPYRQVLQNRLDDIGPDNFIKYWRDLREEQQDAENF